MCGIHRWRTAVKPQSELLCYLMSNNASENMKRVLLLGVYFQEYVSGSNQTACALIQTVIKESK